MGHSVVVSASGRKLQVTWKSRGLDQDDKVGEMEAMIIMIMMIMMIIMIIMVMTIMTITMIMYTSFSMVS